MIASLIGSLSPLLIAQGLSEEQVGKLIENELDADSAPTELVQKVSSDLLPNSHSDLPNPNSDLTSQL